VIKIVLDTNIIVSATLKYGGAPFQVMDTVFCGKTAMFYSNDILAEYKRVLSYKRLSFPTHIQNDTINEIIKYGIFVGTTTKSNINFVDESDRMFYDLAKTVDAYIITGNQKHFPEGETLTPREFLDKISSLSSPC
jgi:putative PIN family toxin of toxin-antitoxin system